MKKWTIENILIWFGVGLIAGCLIAKTVIRLSIARDRGDHPISTESPVVPSVPTGATEARANPSGKTESARPGPLASVAPALLPVAPRNGWVKDRQQTSVLIAQGNSGFILTSNPLGYVHYAVASVEPVNISLVVCSLQTNICEVGKATRQFSNVLSTEGDSIVDPRENYLLLLVEDARDPQRDTLPAVAGALTGNSEPAKHLSAQNRVTVTLFKWACVENCGVQP